jgi:hypothetical protein
VRRGEPELSENRSGSMLVIVFQKHLNSKLRLLDHRIVEYRNRMYVYIYILVQLDATFRTTHNTAMTFTNPHTLRSI